MIWNNRNLSFWGAVLVLGCFFSCESTSSKQALSNIKNIIGTSVVLPNDTVLDFEGMKILVLVEDTGECSICNLHIYDWYIYKLEIDKRNFQCEICYLLDDKKTRLSSDITSMLARYNINYSYTLDEFMSLNSELKDCGYDVFLLSSKNKVSLVGSPLENDKLWDLYKEAFRFYSERE